MIPPEKHRETTIFNLMSLACCSVRVVTIIISLIISYFVVGSIIRRQWQRSCSRWKIWNSPSENVTNAMLSWLMVWQNWMLSSMSVTTLIEALVGSCTWSLIHLRHIFFCCKGCIHGGWFRVFVVVVFFFHHTTFRSFNCLIIAQ